MIARGTENLDRLNVTSPDGRLLVGGLAAQTRVTGGEEALDNLVVAMLGGADTFTMAVGTPGSIPVNVDGGADADVVRYSGTAAADTISVLPNGTEASVSAPATARVDVTAVESLVVLGLGEADTISALNGLATLTALTIDGGEGNDSLGGGDGDDTIIGGPGNDTIDGNRGNDHALLGGPGDDTFQWDPGDASDTLEGQAGTDRLDFNGSNAGEKIELSANAGRTRLTRDIAAITMDFDGIEHVAVRALGAADIVTVNDLAGTDTKNRRRRPQRNQRHRRQRGRHRRRQRDEPPGRRPGQPHRRTGVGDGPGCPDAHHRQRGGERHAARPDARRQRRRHGRAGRERPDHARRRPRRGGLGRYGRDVEEA